VGFELLPLLYNVQVADSTLPALPSMPALPWHLARHCTHRRASVRLCLTSNLSMRDAASGTRGTSGRPLFKMAVHEVAGSGGSCGVTRCRGASCWRARCFAPVNRADYRRRGSADVRHRVGQGLVRRRTGVAKQDPEQSLVAALAVFVARHQSAQRCIRSAPAEIMRVLLSLCGGLLRGWPSHVQEGGSSRSVQTSRSPLSGRAQPVAKRKPQERNRSYRVPVVGAELTLAGLEAPYAAAGPEMTDRAAGG
jgi:hypothetical protein